MHKTKILVIVGPTASGKTSLSIELAKKFNGEIVSADSRQVYKGLDLGTGKISKEEMQSIPHHVLDVADPKDTYTQANYVRDGRKAIADILARKKLPIIVGGTFFYIDALLGKVSTPPVEPNLELRAHLESLSNEELIHMIAEKDPERAKTIDVHNKRRLVRALEIISALGTVPTIQSEELYDSLTLGIAITKEKLEENIHTRLLARLNQGMIEEVKSLNRNGLSYKRLGELGIEYECTGDYLEEKISKEEMMEQIEIKSRQYAKRQMTWLKRDKSIVWIDPKDIDTIQESVSNFLT